MSRPNLGDPVNLCVAEEKTQGIEKRRNLLPQEYLRGHELALVTVHEKELVQGTHTFIEEDTGCENAGPFLGRTDRTHRGCGDTAGSGFPTGMTDAPSCDLPSICYETRSCASSQYCSLRIYL